MSLPILVNGQLLTANPIIFTNKVQDSIDYGRIIEEVLNRLKEGELNDIIDGRISEKITQLENRIKKDLDALRLELEKLLSQNEELQKEFDSNKSEVSTKQDEFTKKYEDELSKIQEARESKIKELEENIQAITEAQEKTKGELDILKNEISELQRYVDTFKDNYSNEQINNLFLGGLNLLQLSKRLQELLFVLINKQNYENSDAVIESLFKVCTDMIKEINDMSPVEYTALKGFDTELTKQINDYIGSINSNIDRPRPDEQFLNPVLTEDKDIVELYSVPDNRSSGIYEQVEPILPGENKYQKNTNEGCNIM